jgi:hypothetical protein
MLALNNEDAKILAALMSRVGGLSSGPRGCADKIIASLSEKGISWDNEYHAQSSGSIYFKDNITLKTLHKSEIDGDF